ncbi:hypothetical protein [Microcystis phage Mwe-JY26]
MKIKAPYLKASEVVPEGEVWFVLNGKVVAKIKDGSIRATDDLMVLKPKGGQ